MLFNINGNGYNDLEAMESITSCMINGTYLSLTGVDMHTNDPYTFSFTSEKSEDGKFYGSTLHLHISKSNNTTILHHIAIVFYEDDAISAIKNLYNNITVGALCGRFLIRKNLSGGVQEDLVKISGFFNGEGIIIGF